MPKFTGGPGVGSGAGAGLYVDLITPGGTVLLNSNWTSFDYDWTGDTTDTTTDSAVDAESLPTIASVMMTWEGLHNGTVTPMSNADLGKMEPLTIGTIRFGQHGTVAGRPKGSCKVIVKKQHVTFPFKDAVKVDMEFERSGPWISDPNTATW